jgi:hypothetical protein
MSLYAGMDLHGNSNYVAIMDSKGKWIAQKKLPNDRRLILETLQPHRVKISGIAVESTYNWYWVVDTLGEAGYRVHLANSSAIQRYSGLKYTDDQQDAFWLAEMLRLGILPEGYIYPKEERRSWADDITREQGPTIPGRCRGQTSWWLTVLWPTRNLHLYCPDREPPRGWLTTTRLVRDYLDTAWDRRFSGSAIADKG